MCSNKAINVEMNFFISTYSESKEVNVMFQTAVGAWFHQADRMGRKLNIIFSLYDRWDDLMQRLIYQTLLDGCGFARAICGHGTRQITGGNPKI